MGFSRQEYCNGLPFPSPGDLPNPGIKPGPPALQADSLLTEPPGKPISELLLASRGIFITGEKLGQFKLGKGTEIAYNMVTDLIKFDAEADIYMRPQSKATIGLIENDDLLNAVEAAVGEL